MKKQIAAVCVSCALVGGILVGCGAQPAQNAEQSEVTQDEAEGRLSNLNSFTAKTADGKEFSNKNFASADVTLITVWSENSESCKDEMADVAAWSKMLPKSVQSITFCTDYDQDGAQVLKDAGFEGVTVVSGDGDYEKFISQISRTPTAVVVDTEGNILEEPVEGAPINLTTSYTKLINQGLTDEGKATINVAAV